jgi:hypothetical protein
MQQLLEATRSPFAAQANLLMAGFGLRVIGEPDCLHPSLQALMHLSGKVDNPDLTIEVRPHLPELSGELGALHLHPDNPDSAQWLNLSARVAAVEYPLPLRTYQQAAPYLPILKAFLQHHNITMLHAGAVALNNAAALLIGRGGSGKSTTALLCLEAGLDYLADDYCAFAGTTVYSLYSSAKIHFADAARVNFIELNHNPDFEKGYTMLFPRFQKQLRHAAPIRALVLPRVGGRLGFEVISPQTALLALAPSTLFQLRDSGEVLSKLAALVRNLPCFRLHLGDQPEAVPEAIKGLLEKL